MSGVRGAILKAGALAYNYLPVPGHWKDRGLALAYRVAPQMFAGQRHYELWRRQADAPQPQPLRDARGAKRILVVDRYVLQPDRDAGSRSMWGVLRALRHMGLAVTYWPRDLLYDSEYVRLMESEGILVLWGRQLEGRFEEWFAAHGAAFDHVFLSRPLVAREFLPAIRRHSKANVLF